MSIKAFFVKVHHTTFEDLRVIFIYTFTVKKKLLIFIFDISSHSSSVDGMFFVFVSGQIRRLSPAPANKNNPYKVRG